MIGISDTAAAAQSPDPNAAARPTSPADSSPPSSSAQSQRPSASAAKRHASAELDLDVGMIYTNDAHYMTPLVQSMACSGDGLKMRLILVDNASTYGVETWGEPFERTTIIKNTKRLGYAPNLNRILAASEARYVLLLNTDMYFDPQQQTLANMTAFMDRNPTCGLSVCRVLHPDGSEGYSARRFPTWRSIVSRRLSRAHLFPHALHEHLYLDRDLTSSFACDWVSGCFMMIRTEAIASVGNFDLGFVKYFEDVDFSLRMALAGWQVMYHGETHCFHHEQRASARLFSSDAWRHCRSYARWLRKWTLRGGYLSRAQEAQSAIDCVPSTDIATEAPRPHWAASNRSAASIPGERSRV